MYWPCVKCSSFGANERIAQVFTVQTNTNEEISTHLGKIKSNQLKSLFWISVWQSRSLKRLQNSIFIWWVDFPSLPYALSLHHFCFTGSHAKAAWFCINLSFGNDWLIKTQPSTTLFSALWAWVLGGTFHSLPSTTSFNFIFLYNKEL